MESNSQPKAVAKLFLGEDRPVQGVGHGGQPIARVAGSLQSFSGGTPGRRLEMREDTLFVDFTRCAEILARCPHRRNARVSSDSRFRSDVVRSSVQPMEAACTCTVYVRARLCCSDSPGTTPQP